MNLNVNSTEKDTDFDVSLDSPHAELGFPNRSSKVKIFYGKIHILLGRQFSQLETTHSHVQIPPFFTARG